MSTTTTRRAAAIALLAGLAAAAAADAYDPSPTYYQSATSTNGATLQTQLRSIVNSGTVTVSYANARYVLDDIDRDPANPANLILTYTGVSVPGAWDAGNTWNREHTWPDSLGLGGSGSDYSDLHMLRPCNPSVNGSRGNKPFGTTPSTWDPNKYGKQYRGEMARICFYMSTRFSHLNLSVVGVPSQLVDWHYAEMPTEQDRVRNQRVFDHQRNRNPFVDHPQWVWAIYGTGPSDARITLLGGVDAGDGATLLEIDAGAVIGSAGGDVDVSIPVRKTGSAPTSWLVTAEGDLVSPDAGRYQKGFARGTQHADLSATLLLGEAPGLYEGRLVIDNTEITSGGAGLGAADGDDVVVVRASVLAPAIASFDPQLLDGEVVIDFGELDLGAAPAPVVLPIHNAAEPPFAAGLDFDALLGAGDTGAFGVSVPAFTGLPAGTAAEAIVSAAADEAGSFEAVYTLFLSDEDLPGAGEHTLTIVARAAVFCAADFDRSGSANVADLLGFLGAFRSGDDRADRDGNGAVDVNDLLSFLGAFRGGC